MTFKGQTLIFTSCNAEKTKPKRGGSKRREILEILIRVHDLSMIEKELIATISLSIFAQR